MSNNDAYSRWPAIKDLLDNPPRPDNQPPAPPPTQVIRGGLIYDPRNPPVRKIVMQKAGEAAVWSLIFGGFAVAAVLVGVGLFLGARLT